MTHKEAINLLKQYNAWRRDDTGAFEMVNVTQLGVALDVVTSSDAQLRVVEYIEQIGCPSCVNNNLLIELAKIKELIKKGAI